MARITARTAAMQLIYERLAGGDGGEDTLQMVYEELRRDGVPGVQNVGKKEPDAEDRAYILSLLEGVAAHQAELDQAIAQASVGWSLERMAKVDLTILRLAAYEILFSGNVPGPAAINEAVELANRYSEPGDSRFINGVLGAILRRKEAGT